MGNPDLSALAPATLVGARDHVYAELRRSVLAGTLKMGQPLTERGLAEALGVSTTPVKEALRMLQAEGLMRSDARRRVVVTFGSSQAEEMVLARASLERTITRLACDRADAASVDAMQTVVEQMGQATQAGSVLVLSELNTRFHDLIHEASRCEYLSRLLQGQVVYDQSTRLALMGDPAEQQRAFAEHARIYSLIRAKDGAGAEGVMFDHVVRSGRLYIASKFASE